MNKSKPVNEVEIAIAAAAAAGININPDAPVGQGEKKIKARFVRGQRFYQFLPFKRVLGKWRVKK